MIATKSPKTTPAGCTTLHQSDAPPTKYRGNFAAGTIEKLIGLDWLSASWRDDLIPYHFDDPRRVALAVLCDFTGDDRASLLLHNLFVVYWNLDDFEGDAWTCRTKNVARWVEKKMRKVIPTPQYIAPPLVWSALERLGQVDPEKFPPLPAIHDPSIVGVKRAPKKNRRRKETV